MEKLAIARELTSSGECSGQNLWFWQKGASTGAIQIAGTDAVTQMPFFITACDYTLIGEELYAASEASPQTDQV